MNVEYDFAFLSKGELPFLLNSLKSLLEQKHYRVTKSDIAVKQMGEMKGLPEIFIMDAADLNANSESRVYIVDLCIQMGIKIVLIGEPEEINQASSLTLANVILETFQRPINNAAVVEKLGELLNAIHEKSKQKRILVIDDSPTFLRVISDWLEEDYIINVCPSATAAFHLIEKDMPDLILLDYEMPICNGAQFLEMLHSEPVFSKIPVMFLTSKDDVNTVKELLSLKPQGYLLKTLTREAILDSIDNFFVREIYK